MDRIDARQRHTITLPEGTWVLRRLGLMDQQRLAGQATLMLGCPFADAPVQAREVAWMWATITLATVEPPDGWDWNAQPDTTTLETLYVQYMEWDASFRAPVAPPAGDMGRGAGTEPPILVPSGVQDPPGGPTS